MRYTQIECLALKQTKEERKLFAQITRQKFFLAE